MIIAGYAICSILFCAVVESEKPSESNEKPALLTFKGIF